MTTKGAIGLDAPLYEALDRAEAELTAKAARARRHLHGLTANGYALLARDVRKIKKQAQWEAEHVYD